MMSRMAEKTINPYKRGTSVEVELASWGRMANARFENFTFGMHGDSSVSSGQEMVIPGLYGDALPAAMIELATRMQLEGVKADSTCGFHVHVDTRDIGWWELRRMTRIYLHLEEFLYGLLPTRRSKNVFCRKLSQHPRLTDYLTLDAKAGSTHDVKRMLIYLITGSMVCGTGDYSQRVVAQYSQFKANKPQNQRSDPSHFRYYGFNLHSMLYRGSVEFRMHHGTTDVAKLIGWPMLCLDIVEAATKMSDAAVDAVDWPMGFVQKYCTPASRRMVKLVQAEGVKE
jgi:hypothetical protein